MTAHTSRTIAERDSALRQDMADTITMIEENSRPTKRWWHRFVTVRRHSWPQFEIKDRPVFTEEQLAERRAFLDGFDAGRADGDSHKAYRLWARMRDNEE